MQAPIKTLQIIHLALVTGVIMAYVLVGRLYTFEFLNISDLNFTSLLVVLGAFIAATLSNVIYKQVLMQVSKSATIQQQFTTYQTATIIRLAILEGTALLILILQPDVLLMGLLLIAYMMLLRPTDMRMKDDLNNSRFL